MHTDIGWLHVSSECSHQESRLWSLQCSR